MPRIPWAPENIDILTRCARTRNILFPMAKQQKHCRSGVTAFSILCCRSGRKLVQELFKWLKSSRFFFLKKKNAHYIDKRDIREHKPQKKKKKSLYCTTEITVYMEK